jgi:hypothetical protein
MIIREECGEKYTQSGVIKCGVREYGEKYCGAV